MKVVSCLLATVLLASVHPADAQQPKKIPQVGWIALFGRNSPNTRASGPSITAFMEGLRERGYIEGQNIIIHYRSADYQSTEGREDRLSKIAAELVRLNVDVILADTNAATTAAAKATTTIPIVFLHGDPVWSGVVPSLAKPGRNVTGLSGVSRQLAGKRLEMLKEVFPKISRVGVILNVEAANHRRDFAEMQSVAEALDIELQALEFRYSKQDFEGIFRQAISQRASAVLTLQGPLVNFHRERIVDLAARNRLPAMYPTMSFPNAGGLMSYGLNSAHQYRRAAYFVDRILKGAKPSDLPVEQPTKFELAINLNTAKALGVTIPPKLLMWADRVISDRGVIPEKTERTMTSTYSTDSRRPAKIQAQPSRRIVRMGYLGSNQSSSGLSPGEKDLLEELHKLGWIEGQNLVIDRRYWENRADRLRAQAAELVRLKVDIILTNTGTAAHAAKNATPDIPIVMVGSADAVEQGLVFSLARPGGNVTGLTSLSPVVTGKRLELLKDAFPGISRVALLRCVGGGGSGAAVGKKEWNQMRDEARVQKIHLIPVVVRGHGEIDTAVAAVQRERADAWFVSDCPRIPAAETIEVATKSQLPAIYPFGYYVRRGGLMSYGADQKKSFRRAAYFVDRILKGAKPADLPVEQPTKFELVINLKAARKMNLTIPSEVLMWADEVIK